MRFVLTVFFLCSCASSKIQTTHVATAERTDALPVTQGAIGGSIVDAMDGRSMPMVMIQAESGGKVVSEDFSDSKGHYRLGPLPPGPYSVTVRFAEVRKEFATVRITAQKQTQLNVRFDMAPPENPSETTARFGSIEGIILDGVHGDIFPGSVVSLEAKHLSNAAMAISDEEGFFRFRGLRPGSYQLSCYYQLIGEGNVEIRKSNIVVVPGEATAVELQMDLSIRL